MIDQPYIKTVFNSLPIELWIEILGLLDIQDALSISTADPRTFGAFIEVKQAIRFKNAFNTTPSFLFNRVINGSVVGYSSFFAFLQRHLLETCIVPPSKHFCDISQIIALKDRGFAATSSILSEWDVSLKGADESMCSVRWKLMYRGSLFGFGAREFHQACDGMGKYVVVVRAENGGIAAAYNEDGFSSINGFAPNRHGFIVSIEADGKCGARFDQVENSGGIYNHVEYGPMFGYYLCISSDCNTNKISGSKVGGSYGEWTGANDTSLFGQEYFRVSDYEVFKIVIE
jgi:hypothetical protein